MPDCPSCSRSFDSERGLNVHHAHTHGESLTQEEVECKQCGKAFTRQKSNLERTDSTFCSRDCWYKYKDKKVETTCSNCGDEFLLGPWYYNQSDKHYCCRECHHESMKNDTPRLDAGSEAREFRKKVYKRDNYTCQDCGEKGNIHAHHIEKRSESPELAFDVNNGVTLCPECHAKRHEQAEEHRAARAILASAESNFT